MGTEKGIHKIRTIKRVPEDKRWDSNLLNTFRGSPWELKGAETPELPAERQLQPIPLEASLPEAEAKGESIERRDFRITRRDVETYGGTANCPGCIAVAGGTDARAHIPSCRERFKYIYIYIYTYFFCNPISISVK